MKKPTITLALSLLAIMLVTACAPAVPLPPPTATLPPAAETEAPAPATAAPAASEQAVMPTSRGPSLEATDPSTVDLASGQLTLVEFFRYT